ncbi:MAG: molecular chaperone DnaK [Myxococcota bacterium]|jgi:molecular chaperone DnaK|nr:molecular chaperone DnaK [Myxococcota bacterium]
MGSGAVIGIDLGTTNSCVAVVENGTPKVIPNKAGYKTTPSIVAITESGKRLVGQMAKRQAITNARNTVYGAKRLIGRNWGSAQVSHCVGTLSYTIVEGPHNDVRIELRDKVYSLPEISSMILTEMKLIAEEYLGQEVDQAVITVPAYFNDGQRQATKDAGRIAGLDVLRIINEPTAAALAYGYGRDINSTIAVYDLGGGTFDISVLDIAEGVFDVISTAGDTFLGGEDFDARIIEWLAYKFAEQHEVDLRENEMALQRLKDAAEKAKCELSSAQRSEINLPFIWTTESGEALHLQVELTRDTLEELVVDLVERTVRICEVTLQDAGLEPSQIGDVVLVGGMSRMPMVQRMVQEYFGTPPTKNVHPDEAVAVGAAIQGAALVSGNDEVLLLDVTPMDLGIAIHGGGFETLIEKNTTIPASATHPFTTSRDNQTSIKVIVLQGTSNKASENELLGEFTLTGLRAAPAGTVDVDISFDISSDGIVKVSAKDLDTGSERSIAVTASSQLTDQEIAAMMAEHQDYLLDVSREDELEDKRVELGRSLREVERLIPQVEIAMGGTQLGANALEKAKLAIDQARTALKSSSVDTITSSHDTLRRALAVFKGIVDRI